MKADKVPASLGSEQLPCLVVRHLCFFFFGIMLLGCMRYDFKGMA